MCALESSLLYEDVLDYGDLVLDGYPDLEYSPQFEDSYTSGHDDCDGILNTNNDSHQLLGSQDPYFLPTGPVVPGFSPPHHFAPAAKGAAEFASHVGAYVTNNNHGNYNQPVCLQTPVESSPPVPQNGFVHNTYSPESPVSPDFTGQSTGYSSTAAGYTAYNTGQPMVASQYGGHNTSPYSAYTSPSDMSRPTSPMAGPNYLIQSHGHMAPHASVNTPLVGLRQLNTLPLQMPTRTICHATNPPALALSPPHGLPLPVKAEEVDPIEETICKGAILLQDAQGAAAGFWVPLTEMSNERHNAIVQGASEKGMHVDTVVEILALFPNSDGIESRPQGAPKYNGPAVKILVGPGASSPSKSKTTARKGGPQYVKRPLNSFMLYRRAQTQRATQNSRAKNIRLNHQMISSIVGLLWQTESRETQQLFTPIAAYEKHLHKAQHPEYKFQPRKRKVNIGSSIRNRRSSRRTSQSASAVSPV